MQKYVFDAFMENKVSFIKALCDVWYRCNRYKFFPYLQMALLF